MKKALIKRIFISIWLAAIFAISTFAQNHSNPAVSEQDEIPALIKHLPDWENTRNGASYILNTDDLKKSLGERTVFDLITLGNGIDAVAATYPQGKLLIVEYPTPQASSDADAQIKQRLAENISNPPVYYRRIGNYNVFVFDASDEAAANGLLDQVKFEKEVRWLGEDPTEQLRAERAEREFAIGIGEMFFSTVIFVAVGFVSTVLLGIIIGLIVFYLRDQKRATTQIFTDAGGMIRLNIDGLTPEALNERLLKD